MGFTPLFRAVELRNGPLQIWEPPIEGQKYVMGVDCAGGGANGDPSAACVIRATDCGLVAVWQERMSPIPWGRCVSYLGWHFNSALMSVESYPSAHGLSAMYEAIKVGYRNMHRRRDPDSVTFKMTDKLGWRTDSRTKPIMIGRVQEAASEGYYNPCEELHREIRAQRYDDGRKMVADGGSHDDLFDAYAIALLTRDEAWERNELREDPYIPKTVDELVWSELLSPQEGSRRKMAM